MDIGSHADTTVMVNDFPLIQDYNQPLRVTRYDPKYGYKMCPIIYRDVASEHLRPGKVYIVV